MPQNRKKARTRRSRQRPDDASPIVTANGAPLGEDPIDDAPEPLEHVSSEADVAAARLVIGRSDPDEVPDEDELEAFEEEEAASLPAHRPERPVERVSGVTRLADFVRGSWRELQRVQWPDRRQVFQATGVVLGFVIVAGAFLGVADLVASKIVNLILK